MAMVVDVALILVFVLIGRSSHGESDGLGGIWRTCWPFLAGLLVGWLVARVFRRRWPVPRAGQSMGEAAQDGAPIVVHVVVVGMALRALSGQGVAVSFVVVTTVVLGVFLIGWRLLAAKLRGER